MSENKLPVCLQKEKRVNSRYFVFETISLWNPGWSQTQFSYFSFLNAGLPSVYHQLWLLKPSGRSEHLEEAEYTSFTEGCRASMSCVRHSTPEPARRPAVTFNSANWREEECLSPFTGSSTSLNRTLITSQQRTPGSCQGLASTMVPFIYSMAQPSHQQLTTPLGRRCRIKNQCRKGRWPQYHSQN